MKRLWIINHYAGTPENGMTFRSYYLACALKKYKVQTTIFSSSYSHVMHNPPVVKSPFAEQDIDGVKYIWVKNFSYGVSKSFGRLWNMIYFCLKLFIYPIFLKKKPEAIIVSSPSPFPIINGWLWARLLGAKLVFEVRDIWPLSITELSNVSKFNPLILLMRCLEVFAYKVCDEVVSLLPHADQHMVPSGLSADKFHYIPNGVLIRKESKTSSCPLDFPQCKFLVGYLGTIGIANNLQLLLDVACLTEDPSVHFVLVGKGALKNTLIERCQREQIKNVSFFDSIPKDQVASVLNSLDICYISLQDKPLFSYGVSPNKLFDYMFARKPIIYCINSGNKPVADAKCGFEIPSQNTQDICDKILEIKSLSKEKRQEMGDRGYQYVCDNHHYDHLAHKYVELLFN